MFPLAFTSTLTKLSVPLPKPTKKKKNGTPPGGGVQVAVCAFTATQLVPGVRPPVPVSTTVTAVGPPETVIASSLLSPTI